MKRILMLCLLLASICCFGQDVQFDLLFDKRQKYSTKKSFNEYCKVMYIQYKENSPPPPPPSNPSLKKMFNIPYYERLKLYPFNEFDSITLIINNSMLLLVSRPTIFVIVGLPSPLLVLRVSKGAWFTNKRDEP